MVTLITEALNCCRGASITRINKVVDAGNIYTQNHLFAKQAVLLLKKHEVSAKKCARAARVWSWAKSPMAPRACAVRKDFSPCGVCSAVLVSSRFISGMAQRRIHSQTKRVRIRTLIYITRDLTNLDGRGLKSVSKIVREQQQIIRMKRQFKRWRFIKRSGN